MTESLLSDYALIGNSCAAALVSKDGSIDWCCLPEFDSPAVFSALLDRRKGGCFSISPAEPYQSSQGYLEDSNVVDTLFTTNDGSVRLIDGFAATHENRRMISLFPDHEILRIVEGISGKVKMRLEYSPRIFYGKMVPVLKHCGRLGIQCSWRENMFVLLSTLEPDMIRIRNSSASTEFHINQGERVVPRPFAAAAVAQLRHDYFTNVNFEK